MEKTRYFIYNHEKAFNRCRFSGITIQDGCAVLEAKNEGFLLTPVMDCLEKGNIWSRLLAHIELPEGAHVVWGLYATDSVNDAQELDRLLLAETLDIQSITGHLQRFSSCTQENSADYIPSNTRGRYAVLTVLLTRPPSSQPVIIRSLQVYSSWESFLQYLPEAFREEDCFLDRFLRLFSAPYLDLEREIDTLADSFDPRTAPPDRLRWLAGVIGIPSAALWETERLRLLLISGTYRKKGRLSALPELIEHFSGYRPYVLECFRMLTGEEENDRLYRDYDLSLFLPPEAADTNIHTAALRQVIEEFLPGGVTYRLQTLAAYPALSGHAYLGVNTHLGRYADTELGVNSRLNFVILGDLPHGEQSAVPVD